jgi:hypothetical protein
MTLLTLHGRGIETVFDLLGRRENGMTYALGWALARSTHFLSAFVRELGLPGPLSERVRIQLQEHKSQLGFTDIEIDDPGSFHVVLEAKRGFVIPTLDQLTKYSDRLLESSSRFRLLVVLAESDREDIWLRNQTPSQITEGIAVKSMSWRAFIRVARSAALLGTHAEKRLLLELIEYLDGATSMQNQTSNLVYVVSLSEKTFGCGSLTFVDVVEKYQKYFHPIGGTGGGWPQEPPNYLGFRYGGELRSIHHVKSYSVIDNYAPTFTKDSLPMDRPHFLYVLGPSIKPPHRLPTNHQDRTYSIYPSGRRKICLDLLLTSSSVAEAAHLTKQRLDGTIGERLDLPETEVQ